MKYLAILWFLLLGTTQAATSHPPVHRVCKVEAEHRFGKTTWRYYDSEWKNRELKFHFVGSSEISGRPRNEWLTGLWVQYVYDQDAGVVHRIEAVLFVDGEEQAGVK